jgi:polar amino acid transport system ATP-binding protein
MASLPTEQPPRDPLSGAVITPMVKYDRVTKTFGQFTVLDKVSFQVKPNECVAVIGPSGSGKSTLLRTLMTLETIDEGLIEVEGEPLWHIRRGAALLPADEKHLRRVRGKIGMVFQQFNLFPHMTAIRNVVDPCVAVLKMSHDDARDRAESLLEMVGLKDKMNNYPFELSGGQQQRVAIARALAMRPKVMLFDEVTSALDPELIGEVLNVIRKLAFEQNLTMILVTHHMGLAREIADRVCYFDKGRIAEEGPPDELFSNPRNDRTRAFLKAMLEV